MRKLLLLAWLPLVVFLFPLPPQAAKQLMSEIHETRTGEQSNVTGEAKGSVKQQASQAELDMAVSALWVRWMQNLGLLVVGVFVGIMAWRRYRYWQVFALGMSIFYLALVVYGYLVVERAVPDNWLFFGTANHFVRVMQLNLRLVEIGISNGSFVRPASIIYNEILMPIFQVAVLAWLMWLRRKSGSV